jgi:hypothetical protein
VLDRGVQVRVGGLAAAADQVDVPVRGRMASVDCGHDHGPQLRGCEVEERRAGLAQGRPGRLGV